MTAIPESSEFAGGRDFGPETHTHVSDGRSRALQLWRLPEPMLAISSAPLGGGVGLRSWVLNAQVAKTYARTDVEDHIREIARGASVDGVGVGMLTAVQVADCAAAIDDGVHGFATVGVTVPAWASAPDGDAGLSMVGTINVVAFLPVRFSDAALVNAVTTVTEAKTQALFEAGVPGTGTASDAVCVLCPAKGGQQKFGGPRSVWGSRLARAVHGAIAGGIREVEK
jgi:adenosylcobinamide hydrolase